MENHLFDGAKYDPAWAMTPLRHSHVRPGPRFDGAPPVSHGARVLLVCAHGPSPREIRATRRMLAIARASFETAHVHTEVLNLSHVGKAHQSWQEQDATGHYPIAPWNDHDTDHTTAHGVLILMPAHWRHTSSALKLLIDRSIRDTPGGTGSSEPVWSHTSEPTLDARTYGLVTHGDLHHASQARQVLCEWLDWMSLVEDCGQAHWNHVVDDNDPGPAGDTAVPDHSLPREWEVRCATAALLRALAEIEAGRLYAPEHLLMRAWPN